MSLLLKSGDQHFEISDTDLENCETDASTGKDGSTVVADRNIVSGTAGTVVMQTPIGSGCTKPTYGASCSKAPNCP
jgi:hypothetical protein